MSSLRAALVTLTLAGASIGCDNRALSPRELIEQKRSQLITSMNIVVGEKSISIPSGSSCTITILGIVGSLQAILTCDGQRLVIQNVKITNGTPYHTTIHGITVGNDSKLDTNTGCMVMRENKITIVYPPGCYVPPLDENSKIDPKLTV